MLGVILLRSLMLGSESSSGLEIKLTLVLYWVTMAMLGRALLTAFFFDSASFSTATTLLLSCFASVSCLPSWAASTSLPSSAASFSSSPEVSLKPTWYRQAHAELVLS